MEIRVKPRRFFLKMMGSRDEDEFFGGNSVISINTPRYGHHFEDEEPPFSRKYWDCPWVSVYSFHDCEEDGDGLVPMSRADAERMVGFAMSVDRSRPLYVHCTAGKSRSQAVGYVMNLYFNRIMERNDGDYWRFEDENSSVRCMNCRVKSLLMESFERMMRGGHYGIS